MMGNPGNWAAKIKNICPEGLRHKVEPGILFYSQAFCPAACLPAI